MGDIYKLNLLLVLVTETMSLVTVRENLPCTCFSALYFTLNMKYNAMPTKARTLTKTPKKCLKTAVGPNLLGNL